jgi:tRNA-dependent cyclodipeptide synthase
MSSFETRGLTVQEKSAPVSLREEVANFNTEAKEKEGWKMSVQTEAPTPVLKKGLENLETKQDILLALCLNNGYYNRENVYRMLKFALAFSNKVQVFTTDGPAKHNYRAFGKPEVEVVRKTRLARNALRNMTSAALKRINDELPANSQKSIGFLEWDGIYADPSYQAAVKELKELYEANDQFKSDVNEITRKVLLGGTGINADTEAVLAEGIQYVLEEVAMLFAYQHLSGDAKLTSEHGANGFNYIYYESWPVFERLMNGEYGTTPQEDIGLVIAKIEEVKE